MDSPSFYVRVESECQTTISCELRDVVSFTHNPYVKAKTAQIAPQQTSTAPFTQQAVGEDRLNHRVRLLH